MNKKITFFAERGHNGDMFTPREYIKQIINELSDIEIEYSHACHFRTHVDIPKIKQLGNLLYGKKIPKRTRFLHLSPAHLCINTWNGAYGEKWYRNNPPYFYFGGTNYIQLTNAWNFIFNNINTFFGTSLKINLPINYLPILDYNYCDNKSIDKINSFFKNNPRKKILVSNGPVHSSQSEINHDMKSIIEKISKTNDVDFICTHHFDTKNKNIFFTNDIIDSTLDWDMIEISYISRLCNIIVGKNSGPFIWCLTKENLNNNNKTIISFNNRPHDSLLYNIEHDCKYIQSKSADDDSVYQIILNEIKKIL